MPNDDLTWVRNSAQSDKLTSLEAAIAKYVRPGMSIYLASDTRAAVRALVRQFWKQRPEFTLIALRVGASHCLDLLSANLARRVIGSSFGLQYPSFRPAKIMQQIFEKGELEIECWSLMALTQRLMAAALGVPFMPTTSMVGSDLAEDNDRCGTIVSPFSHESTMVVQALHPDVTFVHALASDIYGNALVPPPAEDDLWSTRAARNGCIVLAENIVSTDFLRGHAHLVRVPAYRTLAVCHTPFAAHPDGYDTGLDLHLPIQSYLRDTVHYQAYYEASLVPEQFSSWLERWAVEVASQDHYIELLGSDRQQSLRAVNTQENDWRSTYDRIPPSGETGWTASEMMLAAAARVVAEIVKERKLLHCLVGAGSAELAASLALYELRRQGYAFSLINGVGRFGYEPVPMHQNKQLTATMLTGTVDMYGTVVGGSHSRCLALVGAGEVDIHGNINSTKSLGRFLVGSGGVNDAISGAALSTVMMRQNIKRMVPKVEFITCPGTRVSHLVTDEGVFRKNEKGLFELCRFYEQRGGDRSPAQALDRVQQSCGWPVTAATDLAAMPRPTEIEHRLMRWLDPGGRILGRSKSTD